MRQSQALVRLLKAQLGESEAGKSPLHRKLLRIKLQQKDPQGPKPSLISSIEEYLSPTQLLTELSRKSELA